MLLLQINVKFKVPKGSGDIWRGGALVNSVILLQLKVVIDPFCHEITMFCNSFRFYRIKGFSYVYYRICFILFYIHM